MYASNKNKFSIHAVHPQYPFYSTCSPFTLKGAGEKMPSASLMSYRSNTVIIPVSSVPTSADDPKEKSTSPSSSSSSNWQLTFGITTFPFIFFGGPFYLLITKLPPGLYPIRTTRTWLKRLFDCSSFPLTSILSILLLPITTLLNIHFLYVFGGLIERLFIAGAYDKNTFNFLADFVRYIPFILPINYVWLRGFTINNMVCLLDQKHRKYRYVACNYKPTLVLLILVIIGIQAIRFFSYEKYLFTSSDFFAVVDNLVTLSCQVFASLMLPVYCTLCYAIRFELLVIKAIVYDLISKRVAPSISHLNTFKTLYTQAADHIDTVNNVFSIYMSLAILLMIISTVVDAQFLIGAVMGGVANIWGKGMQQFFSNRLKDHIPGLPTTTTTEAPPETGSFDHPPTVRQINGEVVCIILTYALIFFTTWQAVVTNDCARQIHVWLNDFAAGGGGADLKKILMELGVEREGKRSQNSGVRRQSFADESRLIWAETHPLEQGSNDEFLKKLTMLKSYIHVRMELEKPSLLTITLVGLLVPPLSGRLRRYNVLF